jgi:hypothetical protein
MVRRYYGHGSNVPQQLDALTVRLVGELNRQHVPAGR